MGMGNVQRPGGPGKGGRGSMQGMPQTAGYQGLIDKFAPPPAPSRRFGFPQEFQFGDFNQFGGYGPPRLGPGPEALVYQGGGRVQPLEGAANNLAQYGRYGDSMLVHMNPAEVQGIAALSPTGRLTINPVTGQQEAFLPALLPLLGTVGFSSLASAGMLGATLAASPWLAGAISGAAVPLIQGKSGEEVLLGSVLGGVTGHVTGAGGQKAQADTAVAELTKETTKKGFDATSAAGVKALADLDAATDLQTAAQTALDKGEASTLFGTKGSLKAAGKAFMTPKVALPAAIASGQLSAIGQRKAMRRLAEERGLDDEAERAKWEGLMRAGHLQSEYDYPPYEDPRHANHGGIVSINPANYARRRKGFNVVAGNPVRMQAGGVAETGGSAAQRQARLRGPKTITPEELAAAGRAGFDPEITYFEPRRVGVDPATGGAAAGQPSTPEEQAQAYAASMGNWQGGGWGGKGGGWNPAWWGGGVGSSAEQQIAADYPGMMDDQAADSAAAIASDFVEGDGATAGAGAGAGTVGSAWGGVGGGTWIDPATGVEFDYSGNIVGGDPGKDSVVTGAAAGPSQSFVGPAGGAQIGMPAGPIAEAPVGGYQALIDRYTKQYQPDVPPPPPAAPPPPVKGPPVAGPAAGPPPGPPPGEGAQPGEGAPPMPGAGFGYQDLISQYMPAPGTVTPPMPPPPVPAAGPLGGPPLTPEQQAALARAQAMGGWGGYGFQEGGITDLPPALGPDQQVAMAPPPAGTMPPEAPTLPPPAGMMPPEAPMGMEAPMGAEGPRQNQAIDQLIEQTMMAVLGQLPPEQAEIVIAEFIDQFGEEAFQMLREQALQMAAPGAQTQGLIAGQGGGMDDQIPGMIGNQQPVAVSPGEFIVPADVVSGLGDGSSDAGAAKLDGMMDDVRMAKTGGVMQPRRISNRVLPA